jgi:hypothetical protein
MSVSTPILTTLSEIWAWAEADMATRAAAHAAETMVLRVIRFSSVE